MSFETPTFQTSTAPPPAPPTNKNHLTCVGRSWDCLAYDRKGWCRKQFFKRFLVPSRSPKKTFLGSQKAHLQNWTQNSWNKKWEEFQSWNFPLWNRSNLNQETAPPPQFFLVHPLRFSLKNHGCLEHDRSSLALENFSNGKTSRGWWPVSIKPAGMLERSTVSFMFLIIWR